MMKRFLTIFLTLALLLGLFALPAGASSATLDTAAKKAAAFAVSSVPHPGAGDDWVVIGAVRGGFDIPEHWTDSYYRAIAARLQETNGVLSKTRPDGICARHSRAHGHRRKSAECRRL